MEDKIYTLRPGLETDLLIARKIMGCKDANENITKPGIYNYGDMQPFYYNGDVYKFTPSINIDAAIHAMLQLDCNFTIEKRGLKYFVFIDWDQKQGIFADDTLLSMAICRATLLAKAEMEK